MNPAFHRKCLKDFVSNFKNVCYMFLTRLNTVVDGGKPTSVVQEFANVTLEVIITKCHSISIPMLLRILIPHSHKQYCAT